MSELLEGLSSGLSLGAFGLLFARLLPLGLLAPFLGMRGAALWARLGAVLVLCLVFYPLQSSGHGEAPAASQGDLWWPLLALRELTLGGLFALVASAPLYGLRWAGALSDHLRLGAPAGASAGSGGSAGSAGGEGERSPLGLFYLLLGLALFSSLGGHRLALRALAEGLLARPVGAAWEGSGEPLLGLALAGAEAAGWALAFSLSFAAPLMIALVLLTLSLGAAERVAPSSRAALLEAPLRGLAALAFVLLGLAVLVPHLPGLFAQALGAAGGLFGGP